jgi:hypothetical protein
MKNPAIRKKSEKNTTIRKFSKREESSNPVIRKDKILVLVKEDRQMESQVDPIEDKDFSSC